MRSKNQPKKSDGFLNISTNKKRRRQRRRRMKAKIKNLRMPSPEGLTTPAVDASPPGTTDDTNQSQQPMRKRRFKLWQGKNEPTKQLVLHLLGDKTKECELPSRYEEDADLLQDLDLAILASSPADYKTYTELLRKEYHSMSDESYKIMRLKVLETLLIIPSIFATKEFQAKYEQAARDNIRLEIERLKAAH